MTTKSIFRATYVTAAVWLVAVFHAGPAVQAQSDELPPGEGRETVLRVCSDCHGVDQVAAYRRPRAEWQSVVEDMAGRNGTSAEDTAAIVKYVVSQFGRINVNIATAADLVEIVGLPEAEAAAIVDYRGRKGEFKTFDDLKQVPGVDVANLESRKDRLAFTGP